MRRIVSCLSSLLLILTTSQTALAEGKPQLDAPQLCRCDLPSAIDKILDRPELARSRWGIEIQTLESGNTLYSLNGEQFFTPASSLKLLTSAAGLLTLGQITRLKPLFTVWESRLI